MENEDVFVSYSSKEYEQANIVRLTLKNNGISCWMAPESIPGGSSYTVEIPKAIKNCKVFVVVLSTLSQESKWVSKEIQQALNNNKVIIPFLIENCKITDSFNFMIGECQRINAFEETQKSLEELVNLLKTLLNKKIGEKPVIERIIPERSRTTQAQKTSFVTDDGDYYEGIVVKGKPHGKGKMEYANGDVYDGFWKEGQRNGKGKIIYSDGSTYEGTWKNDTKDGKGKMKYNDEDIYIGDWKNDKRDGNGKYSWNNGKYYYIGEWKDDKKTGKGKSRERAYEYYNGVYTYEGNYLNGMFDGVGKLILTIKTNKGDSEGTEVNEEKAFSYEGNFKNNKFDGYGKIVTTAANKGVSDYQNYEGEWKDGKYNGKGKIIYGFRNYLEGEFKDGKILDGYAEEQGYTLTGGDGYITTYRKGQWVNRNLVTGFVKKNVKCMQDAIVELELKDGEIVGEYKVEGHPATYEYDKNDKTIVTIKWATYNFFGNIDTEWTYVGNVKEGIPHGKGKIITKYQTLTGNFKYGHVDGDVEVKYRNGDYYKGVWNELSYIPGDYPSGYGEMKNHDGSYYKGEWDCNGYKDKGYGKEIYDNGYYEGEFLNGKRHGKGKYVWNGGSYYDGEWKEGKQHGKGIYKGENGKITSGYWTDGQMQ